MDKFVVKCWAGLHGNEWVVVRVADRRVMTSGSVITCLRWVDVWGPVLGDKRGMELSSKAIL